MSHAEKLLYTYLENRHGNHYKQYTLWVEKNDDGNFEVHFEYGRIGKPPVGGVKGAFKSVSMARVALQDIRLEKERKGYAEVSPPEFGPGPIQKALLMPIYGKPELTEHATASDHKKHSPAPPKKTKGKKPPKDPPPPTGRRNIIV